MRKFFYTDGTSKYGPFTLEELKDKGISRDTKIWYEGLDQWKPAADVPELSEIIKSVPPPIAKEQSTDVHSMEYLRSLKPPKTWLIESILVTLFCCLPFGIVGIVNAAKVESRFYARDIEGANRSSADAKKWTTISFWIGIAVGVIYLIVVIAGVASGY